MLSLATLLVFVHCLLYLSSTCKAAEWDARLNEGDNVPLDDHLYDTDTAAEQTNIFEEYYSIPSGFFRPIFGYSMEIEDRVADHIAHPETRFTLIGNDDDPHGVMAFTAYSFQQPRTRRTKRAVAMLRLTPGRRGELVGEAHFPVGLDRAWLRDLSRRIHGSAYWDKENLIRRFGYDVLRL